MHTRYCCDTDGALLPVIDQLGSSVSVGQEVGGEMIILSYGCQIDIIVTLAWGGGKLFTQNIIYLLCYLHYANLRKEV